MTTHFADWAGRHRPRGVAEYLLGTLEADCAPSRTDQPLLRRIAGAYVLLTALALLVAGCSADPGLDSAIARPTEATAVPVPDVNPGRVVAVEESPLGSPQVDVHGNSINVHGWARWPGSIADLDPFGEGELNFVGELAVGREPGVSIAAVDVEVCASQDQAIGTELLQARFGLSAEPTLADQTDSDLRTAMVLQPVVQPAFMWPAAGECERGWQALTWAGSALPTRVGFTAVSMAEGSFGDRWVYEWLLGEAGPISSVEPSDERLLFVEGPHRGWEVSFLGWSEVPATTGTRDARNREYFQPREGQRLVATLIEACAPPGDLGSAGDLPVFALQVQGWTLIAPAPAGEVWGPGYGPLAVPAADECTRGWIPFEVPEAVGVSGLFATDSYLLGRPYASWSFGAPMSPPQVGAGFPNSLLIETVQAQCGAGDPMEVTRPGGEATPFVVRGAVAVQEGDARMVIYASEQTLTPDDIPEPNSLDLEMLKIVVDNGVGPGVLATEYRDDFSNNLYGSISLLDGSRPGAFAAFIGATVVVDEINGDYVCLTLNTSAASPSVSGRLGAPIWSPS